MSYRIKGIWLLDYHIKEVWLYDYYHTRKLIEMKISISNTSSTS